MSDKEMLKEADEWLYSMKCLLSVKTDEEDRAYTQKRIDLFNWLIGQTERAQELEKVVKSNFKHHKHQQEMIFELEQQNKRYREVLEYSLRKINIDINSSKMSIGEFDKICTIAEHIDKALESESNE